MADTQSEHPSTRRTRQPRRRPALPAVVRRTRRRRAERGRGGRLRLRHGQPGRAPRRPSTFRSSFPRSTRCRPPCAASRTSTWTRPRTTATRPTSAATSRPTSPCSCAAAQHPDGADPEAGPRGATPTPATPTSSGPRSGSACTRSRSSPSTCPARAAGRPDLARRRRLRERPPLRRGADRGAHRALREGHRQALRHRPAARGDGSRQHHEPRLEAGARAQPQPPVALQRAHRRHHLPRRRQRLPRHAARAPPTSRIWSRRWSTRPRTASAR